MGNWGSEYSTLLERVNLYQRDKNDKNLKEDIIKFLDKYLDTIKNKSAHKNLQMRFEALKNEDIRIGAYPPFSA